MVRLAVSHTAAHIKGNVTLVSLTTKLNEIFVTVAVHMDVIYGRFLLLIAILYPGIPKCMIYRNTAQYMHKAIK